MAIDQFAKTKSGTSIIWLNKDIIGKPLEEAIKKGFNSPDKNCRLDKVPSSKFADVYRFSDNNGSVYYFKQYRCRSAWDVIKHLFRPSRAQRSLIAAGILAENGFSSPDIIAMGFRNRILKAGNFLITRQVENSSSVESFFKERYAKLTCTISEKRNFIKMFGHFVGRLHSKNISHGDLRLSNVLVVRSSDSDFEFFLLDNERTIRYSRLPGRLRLKNLVQVNMFQSQYISRTDRLRFLKSYLSENHGLISKWKRLAIKVHDKTHARLNARNRLITVG